MSDAIQFTFSTDRDLAKIARQLKQLDSRTQGRLKNDLAKAMRKIGKQFVDAERKAIRSTHVKGVKAGGGIRHKRGGKPLPAGHGQGIRGPIAKAVTSRSRLTNSARGGTVAGVEVRVSRSAMPTGMDGIPSAAQKGRIRHPLFGDRDKWFSQVVSPAGWWSNTGRQQMQLARADLIKVGEEFQKAAEAAMQG